MPHDKHGLHLPCNMSRTPHGLTPVGIWMGETATDIWRANHGIEKRVFNHIARQGVIGVWSAHIDALIKFLHHDRGKPNKENFMLVLEDDVELDEHFFVRLPAVLNRMPHLTRPWHVIRFDTWGFHNPQDVVKPGIWRCFSCPFSEHTYFDRPYGGAHATLYQRDTASATLAYLLHASGRQADHIDDVFSLFPPVQRPANLATNPRFIHAIESFAIRTGTVHTKWLGSDRDPNVLAIVEQKLNELHANGELSGSSEQAATKLRQNALPGFRHKIYSKP